MYSDIAIKVERLCKCYQIYDKPRDRLLQMLMRGRRQFYREFWALMDVSFEVKKGETVGIIGRNGSGKSTLLQIVCGTLSPTSGSIETQGRIAALLELGSGFNPEFTGRENVYMNAVVMGLDSDTITKRFSTIADFAEIGQFMDQPVKTYSSGMFTRLAFACAINVDPEILVVDEALAVGDAQFQARCVSKMRQITESGCTVLFVSHDITSVKNFCQKAIYLKDGEVKAFGPANVVADLYSQDIRESMLKDNARFAIESNVRERAKKQDIVPAVPQKHSSLAPEFFEDPSFVNRVRHFRQGTGAVQVRSVQLLDSDNVDIQIALFRQQAVLRICIEFLEDVEGVFIGYYIRDSKNIELLGSGNTIEDNEYLSGKAGDKIVIEFVTKLSLHAGVYNISIVISVPIIENKTALFLDHVENVLFFEVLEREPHRIWSKVYINSPMQIWKSGYKDASRD